MQTVDYRLQSLPRGGERVFHFRRNLGIDFPGNNPVALKFPQVLGENLLRDTAHAAAQLAEATRTGEQFAENQKLPFAADNAKGSFRRTGDLFSPALHRTTYLVVRPLP